MSVSVALLSTFLVLAPPPPTSTPIAATGEDVLRGWLCLEKDLSAWKVTGLLGDAAACKPIVTEHATQCAGKLKLDLGGCWLAGADLVVKRPDGAALTIKKPDLKACKHMLQLKGDVLTRANDISGTQVLYGGMLLVEADGGRAVAKVEGGKTAGLERITGSKSPLLTTTEGGDICVDDRSGLASATPPPPPPPPTTGGVITTGASGESTGEESLAELEKRCWVTIGNKKERGQRRRETVCVSTDGSGRFITLLRPRRLMPGQPLRFVLLGSGQVPLRARQEGAIGYEIEFDEQTTIPKGASVNEDPKQPKPTPTVSVWVFEGRSAGPAPIILEDDKGKEVHRVEIVYPSTYFGSLRVGVAVVGLGAVRPEYAAVQTSGSMTYEVAEKAGGNLAFELVLAYSIYPEAMFGGRDYKQPLFTRNNWGVGPVFGIGAVSVAGNTVEVFKSLYLGLEFEPVRWFSLSVGPVFRRVDLLADGLHVGSALRDASVPTKQRIAVGGFLMINFTPRFMKTAYKAN